MPAAILHTGCTFFCAACQTSLTPAVPEGRALKEGDYFALVVGDRFVPTLCNGPNLKPPKGPCNGGVRWEGASSVLSTNGSAVLLRSSKGQLEPPGPPRQIRIVPPSPPSQKLRA